MSSASKKLIQASGGGEPVGASDDDFANVVLLLDGDGTSGDDNKTFTDSSTNGFTVTKSGNVVQGSFSPYGDNWSNYLDYDAYINNVRNISSNPLGTQDFTIEFFFNATEENGSYKSIYGEGYTVQIYYKDNSIRTWFSSSDNTSGYFITSLTPGGTPTPGQWHHFAVVRNGNTFTAYLDGVGGTSQTSSTAVGTAGFAATIGANALSISSYEYSGYVSNFRMVIGTAVYTSDFTPPTSPLTAITNTEVLTCSSNAFKDESTNNHSLSPATTGTDLPKVTPFSPFKNSNARNITTDGGSAYFDGNETDNYLTLADAQQLGLDSDDFTLEAWIYTNGAISSDYQAIWSKWYAGGQEIFFSLSPTLQLALTLYFGSNSVVTSTATITANEWTHVAATRNGGTVTIWINGQSAGTMSVSGAVTNNTASVYVGNYQVTNYYEFNGYISDVRWVKGTAVYTSAFTPPTAPLTAITNTETLLSFQDAGIYDRSGINNLDTVDNAQIDTAVKKYGTGSIEFDGTGDYLDLDESEVFGFGTGDFTVEMWAYTTDNTRAVGGASQRIFDIGGGDVGIWVQSSTGYISYNIAGSVVATTTLFPENQWNHVAFTRNGTSLKLFLNGTQAASTTNSSDLGSAHPATVGAFNNTSDGAFLGYIDDLRVTKGIARYTSAFTPPSAALPKF